MQETIILLTGTPSAGKTTIAETLSRTFTQSAHVSVDFFRKQIKAGYASPHHWNDEVERQYRLARKNAALTAKNIYPFPQNTKSSPVEARVIASTLPYIDQHLHI